MYKIGMYSCSKIKKLASKEEIKCWEGIEEIKRWNLKFYETISIKRYIDK